ncbi:MAG: hypothetical protein S4CHLAM123_05400 [Chlamydiales bacterium]|nr:hypothetical protein [Chlamydiales bacterium]
MKPHLTLAHSYWSKHIRPGDRVIDATAGNGHDTLYLAQLLNGEGELIAYDIQAEAIFQTQNRLLQLSAKQRAVITLKNQSHTPLEETSIDLIVYNLGYLPGGDKSLTTCTQSTLKSVQSALKALSKKGALCITCYPGHPEGKNEQKALLDYLESLESNHFEVRFHQWINRPLSPTVLWIQPF